MAVLKVAAESGKRKKEPYLLFHGFFFNSSILILLLFPFFVFFWPTYEGPYPYTVNYLILVVIAVFWILFSSWYLKKNIPVRFQEFARAKFKFGLFYFSFMGLFVFLEIMIRILGLAEWGGGQGPLQRDFGLKKYDISAEGFRGIYVPAERMGSALRIMGLGDSFGFGQGVGAEEVYLEQLKKLLKQKMPEKKIEVINRSKPGWNTIKEYQYFSSKGTLYDPDILVILYCLNDPEFGGFGNLVRETDTAGTKDTAFAVEHHGRTDRNRFLFFDFFFIETAVVEAETHVVILKPALAGLVADRAVERVVGE